MARPLSQLEDAIKGGNKDKVEAEIKALVSNRSLLRNMGGKCVAHELIIYACKYKRSKILSFLLYESNYLLQLKNTALQVQQENKQRIDAFYYALCDNNMNMVTMLYNYWGNVTHWPIQSSRVNDENIGLIRRLDNILDEAKAKCKLQLILDQNMKVNVQCFIKFIKFQLSIYTKLDKNKLSARNAIEAIRTVLGEYESFKEIESVRLPKETSVEDELTALEELSDKSTLYPKIHYHHMYDEYYKKLDYSTALLILDKLHIMKKKCNVQKKDIYHEIECTIFYYIWRVSENWILYVPSKPSIYKQECDIKNKEQITRTKIDINVDKIENAPVIYLERQKFEKCLMNLLTHFNASDYDQNNNILFDMKYLEHLPYMRDYYSLKKTVYYINAVENDTNADELCIQRALMVIGEMTKSSRDSKHLSSTARALLEAGISVDTMQVMIYIRNNIAKADEGKLNKRIEVTTQNKTIFRDIQKELKEINKHIKTVVEIYERILNKTMIQHGLDLIQERIKQWSPDAKKHMDYIHKSLDADDIDTNKQYSDLMKITGLSCNYLIEIEATLTNRKILQTKLQILQNHCMSIAKSELPKYISYINDTLNGMRCLDATKKKITIQSIQNVLKFFSDLGAFEHHTHQIVLMCIYKIQRVLEDTEPLYSAEQSISKLIYTIGNNTSTNYKTFSKIKELNRLFITKSYNDLRKEREELLSDLIDRVYKLRDVLECDTRPAIKQLWVKYVKDQKFRLSFEMLLSDIFNIFCECGISKLLYKPDKLLTSVNLRVVLAHGDPILEVLGDILDPNDFPTALLEKAMTVANAGPSIVALNNLFRDKIALQTIKNNQTNKLNRDQKIWLSEFRRCNDCDTYLNLIIINKQKSHQK